MRLHSILLAAAIAAFALPVTAAEPLTVAQVEKVTGLTGLSVKPGKYDKASKNFVNAKGDLAISVKVAGASVYDVWKSQASTSDQAAFSGLGDDAIISKNGRYVCFKKHGTGVCVTGMVALQGGAALVSDAQVLELARLAAAGL